MAQALVPECIICLQPYDHELNIPRVLACGHTFCEPCLHELHTTWQSSTSKGGEDSQSGSVLRCPECNHRTRLPLGGQKFLPKNVALLRLLPNSSDTPPIGKAFQNLKPKRSRKLDGAAKRVDVSSRNLQRRATGESRTNFEVLSEAASSTVSTSVARILHNSLFPSSLRLDPGSWDVKAWILPQEVVDVKENSSVSSDGGLLYGEIVEEQAWAGSRISVSLLRIEGRKSEGLKTLHADVENKSLEAEWRNNEEKSYEQELLEVADGVDYETKLEICLLFRISSICHRICKTFGLWMSGKQELYLVSEYPETGEQTSWDVLKKCSTRSWSRDSSQGNSAAGTSALESLRESTGRAELELLSSIGVRLCEVLLEVHSQGLILGLLSPGCIVFDPFDNLLLDTNTALRARHLLQETTRGCKRFISSFKVDTQVVVREESEAAAPMNTTDSSNADADSNCQRDMHYEGKCWEYMSPEVLALLTSNMLHSEDEDDSDGVSCSGFVSEDAFLSPEDEEARINSKADAWSLGCIILELITGKSPHAGSDFNEVLQHVHNEQGKPKSFQGLGFQENRCDDLELGHHTLQNLLVRCFEHDPKERADIYEILQGFKELQLSNLVCKKKFNRKLSKNESKGVDHNNWILCLPGFGVDGWFEYERKAQAKKLEAQTTQEIIEHDSEAPRAEVSCETDTLQAEGEEAQGELETLEECFVELKGSLEDHRDDVTALIVCGNYLLSASFDKTVRVWSLERHELLKTLEGHHTQVILALAMDLASMRCFSGDQLGHICAWELKEELEAPLLASWQEHNDWRYTGVASLAVSGDGMLYSGSGDRTIKAWSSQSFELLGTMEGHKALVSTLVVDGELLYSGSWDGVIRVWWRNDHSPMAVLSTSDPMMGGVRSMCLSNGMLFVGREDGSIQVWMDEEYLTDVRAHKTLVSSLCVEGPFLYSGSWDHSIKVWRINGITSHPLPALEVQCGSGVSALTSDGDNLYAALLSSVKVYSIFSASSASSRLLESDEQEENESVFFLIRDRRFSLPEVVSHLEDKDQGAHTRRQTVDSRRLRYKGPFVTTLEVTQEQLVQHLYQTMRL